MNAEKPLITRVFTRFIVFMYKTIQQVNKLFQNVLDAFKCISYYSHIVDNSGVNNPGITSVLGAKFYQRTFTTQMPINKGYRHKSPQVGEAGFTIMEMIIVIVISSILGIFVFGSLNKCLLAQKNMQVRKEGSDDAILSMERINKDLREANIIYSAGNNILIFRKNVTSSTDTNTFIKYVRDIPTNRVMRQSAASLVTLPGNSTSGSVIARNVSYFYSVDITLSRVFLEMKFDNGSNWQTHSFPRNYGL